MLADYKDTLAVADDEESVFEVKNQERLESFFSDLMQNADYNNAYNAYKDVRVDDWVFRDSLDYKLVRDVEIDDTEYSGIGLFNWAMKQNL